MSLRGAIGLAVTTIVFAAGVGAARDGPSKSRATALSGNPAEFFGTDNYPPEAIRNHEQGRTVAKLQVGPDGHVRSCTVDVSSGSAALDKTTCDIALAKVIFTPATDARGRAIASTYTLPVRWILPEGVPGGPGSFMPLQPLSAVIEMAVEANGAIRSCAFRVNGSTQANAVLQSNEQICATAGPRAVQEIASRLPAALRGRAYVLLSGSRQEYSGMAPPPSDASDVTVLERIVTRFTIGVDGKVSNCRIEGVADSRRALARPPCVGDVPFRRLDGGAITAPVEGVWTETSAVRALPGG